MTGFPQQSINQAREIVSKYKTRGKSKLSLANQLYNNCFTEIHYGFSESIKSGNCGKYLHEIRKEADCFTRTGVDYLIAKEAGLNPKIYLALGIRDVDEGESIGNQGPMDHSFIIVDTKKNEKTVIDINMGLFGKVKLYEGKHLIEVYNKSSRKITRRTYSSLVEMSEQEYLEKLEEGRTPAGGRIALSKSQRLNSSGQQIYASYLPETSELKSSSHGTKICFFPEPYNKHIICDLITKVDFNGNYDFENGRLEFYHVKNTGWPEHEGCQLPMAFPARDALKFLDIVMAIAKKSGRKSPVRSIDPFRLEDMVHSAGFKDDFSIAPGSEAQALANNGLESAFQAVFLSQKMSVDNFLTKVSSDESSYRVLLRGAQYTKRSDSAKSDSNPYGFIFSEADYQRLLETEFKKYKRNVADAFNALIESNRITVGLKKGSRYHADRINASAQGQEHEQKEYLNSMAITKMIKSPLLFKLIADRTILYKQFELESMPIEELKKGLTEKDLFRAAQQQLFEWLILFSNSKEALFLPSFKKGLANILNQE